MRIDSNGNVGIGTDSPSQKLEVVSDAGTIVRVTSGDSNGSFLDLGKASSPTGGRIGYDPGNNLLFCTETTEKMRIKSNGNVGIGTEAPSSDLQVGTYGSSGVRLYKTGYTQVREDGGSGGFECYKDGSGSANRSVRITTAGNGYFSGKVGIGTDAPAEKLHVAGNIKADNFNIGGITKDSYLRSDADDSASGNLTFNGRTNIRGSIDISDGQNVDFGSSDDIKFYYQGSNDWLYCDFKTAGNGIIFKDGGTDIMVLEDSGIFRPSANNTGAIGSSSNYWNHGYFFNHTVNGTIFAKGAIDLTDNVKIRFGSGDDTEMYYNGSHTYIDLKTEGNFYIRDGTTSRFFVTRAGNATLSGKLTAGNFDLESLPALP